MQLEPDRSRRKSARSALHPQSENQAPRHYHPQEIRRLVLLCYKLAEPLWGSLVSCGRLSIGPLPRPQPTGGGNQPPRRFSTCPTSMAHTFCNTVILVQRAGLEIDVDALRLIVVAGGGVGNLRGGEVELRLAQLHDGSQPQIVPALRQIHGKLRLLEQLLRKGHAVMGGGGVQVCNADVADHDRMALTQELLRQPQLAMDLSQSHGKLRLLEQLLRKG